LNGDPPDFCLLSRQDYRQEPPVPGCDAFLFDICASITGFFFFVVTVGVT
jgi:hypothetical protein